MNDNNIIIKGKVTWGIYGKTNKDDRELYRLTLESENLDDEMRSKISELFKDASMSPKFLKDKKNNKVNLKSAFDIPVDVRDSEVPEDEKEIIKSYSEWLADGRIIDAEVSIKVVLKKTDNISAMYPLAIVVHKMGSVYDPFDFD